MGDAKLMGFVKSFAFCDISGAVNPAKRDRARFIIFWHEGARKQKRRECACTLNRPSSLAESVSMTVQWKSIAAASANNALSVEQGTYTMTKDDALAGADLDAFQFTIGLCRHEFLDAMLAVAAIKFPQNKVFQSHFFQSHGMHERRCLFRRVRLSVCASCATSL